jgi:hypothetical protein
MTKLPKSGVTLGQLKRPDLLSQNKGLFVYLESSNCQIQRLLKSASTSPCEYFKYIRAKAEGTCAIKISSADYDLW